MNPDQIATATPVEIDTRIAKLRYSVGALNAQLANMDRRENAGLTINLDEWDHIKAQRNEMTREYIKLSREFTRRGTWTRYYLATSHNGHVHSSMWCSTCNRNGKSTDFYWLTSESGATAEDVVAKARAQACTTCFPWAPVTTRRGEYRTPDQEEKERRAAERAARKAAADAKKITTPNGGELFEAEMWRGKISDGGQIKTGVAAQRRLVQAVTDMAFYGPGHMSFPAWQETARRCAEALSTRLKVTQESLFKVAIAKATAKARRESWTVSRDLAEHATPRP